MKFFSAIILTFSALASTSALAPRQTVSKIESDAANILTQVNTLHTSITAFANPSGTQSQALAIHLAIGGLVDTLTGATNNVKATPSPFSGTDGTAILKAVAVIVSPVVDSLTGPSGFVAKKAAFAAITSGAFVATIKQDLEGLQASTDGYENALISSVPTNLKGPSTTLKAAVDTAFVKAVAAYS